LNTPTLAPDALKIFRAMPTDESYATIRSLRQATKIPRERFDAGVQELRIAWIVTLAPIEGRHGKVDRKDIDFGIEEGDRVLALAKLRDRDGWLVDPEAVSWEQLSARMTAIADPQSGLVRIGSLYRGDDWREVNAALFRAYREGLIELRPEGGFDRLSPAERKRLPRGAGDVPLSYAAFARGSAAATSKPNPKPKGEKTMSTRLKKVGTRKKKAAKKRVAKKKVGKKKAAKKKAAKLVGPRGAEFSRIKTLCMRKVWTRVGTLTQLQALNMSSPGDWVAKIVDKEAPKTLSDAGFKRLVSVAKADTRSALSALAKAAKAVRAKKTKWGNAKA